MAKRRRSRLESASKKDEKGVKGCVDPFSGSEPVTGGCPRVKCPWPSISHCALELGGCDAPESGSHRGARQEHASIASGWFRDDHGSESPGTLPLGARLSYGNSFCSMKTAAMQALLGSIHLRFQVSQPILCHSLLLASHGWPESSGAWRMNVLEGVANIARRSVRRITQAPH